MKILYFDCFSGVSGDMTLAALLDLGLPLEKLQEELKKLGLKNYSLEVRPGSRSGIAALGLEVKVGPQEEHHRHFSDIREMISRSSLVPGVKELSLAIFQRLAEAEARVHKKKVEEVHFHEVGAVDSIVDIVGTAIGISFLRPDRIYASELPMGWGFVNCQHGRIPLPAPATVEVLKGYPVKSVDVEGELVTPTGAAIVATLSSKASAFPAMKVEKIGYGMGKKEFPDRPNLLRLILGEATEAYQTDRAMVLESNIDDMNPEFYDYVIERLFSEGANDVWLTPIQMKKTRPGTVVNVLCSPKDASALKRVLLEETSTFGLRTTSVMKKAIEREFLEVETPWGKVNVKVGRESNHITSISPEFADCARIAGEQAVPIKEVFRKAQALAQERLE